MIARFATLAALIALAFPASAAAQGSLDANCPGPRDGTTTHPPPERFAQTFTALTTGALTSVQVDMRRSPGGGGDYVADINDVDGSGVPTNNTLATASAPTAAFPEGDFTLAVSYAQPATVIAGQRYALVLTRLSGNLTIGDRMGDVCPDGSLFNSATHTAPFTPGFPGLDMIFSVFVEPMALDLGPPLTSITKGPKAKTRKRSATFEFTADDVGSSFVCSLDGGPFQPCSSPKTYDKLKRKKHHFEVTATDPSGNVDPSPATFDWKVKKKHK